jgi:pyocin large subunit-like protein
MPIETHGWGASVGFADQRRLDEHFGKHGAEFGRITKQDYLRQAQLLRDAKVGGPVLEVVRRDGVVTRYDQQTGAFIAFNSNGVIRTFFKPNDGERYWRRQAERGE